MSKIGQFTILKPLASGGMANIFLAKKNDSSLNQLFAIKRIADGVNDKWYYSKLFLREAQLSITFDHPNLVKTYEVGSQGDDLYLVQEFIDGVNLREVFKIMNKSQSSFSAIMLNYLMSEISLGLAYLHGELSVNEKRPQEVCVHRDISPHNIMIGHNGDVKIIDFGITKSGASESLTTVGSVRGKYAYMSPEQARGYVLGPSSDIFSLGIIYYELFTGKRFFESLDEIHLIKCLDSWSSAEVEKRISDLGSETSNLLRSMLAEDPEQRPSASKLKNIFETQLKSLPSGYGKIEFAKNFEVYFKSVANQNTTAAPFPQMTSSHLNAYSASAMNSERVMPTQLTLYDVLVEKKESSSSLFAPLLMASLLLISAYYLYEHPEVLYNISRKPASETKNHPPAKINYSKSLLIKLGEIPAGLDVQVEINKKALSREEIKMGFKVFDGDTLSIKTKSPRDKVWREREFVIDSGRPPALRLDL